MRPRDIRCKYIRNTNMERPVHGNQAALCYLRRCVVEGGPALCTTAVWRRLWSPDTSAAGSVGALCAGAALRYGMRLLSCLGAVAIWRSEMFESSASPGQVRWVCIKFSCGCVGSVYMVCPNALFREFPLVWRVKIAICRNLANFVLPLLVGVLPTCGGKPAQCCKLATQVGQPGWFPRFFIKLDF